jgi:hypothetical protein
MAAATAVIEFAVPPALRRCPMEINPIRRSLDDLDQRTTALRGFL